MRPLDIFLAIAVAALWGFNFVAAKYAMAQFPPFFLTSLRFACVALLLAPFVPRPPAPQMRRIAALALVLGVMHFAVLFAALNAGLNIAGTAITVQLGVPFSCLLGVWFMHDALGKWRILGMTVAFSGMLLVAGAPNVTQHPLGFMLALAGAFFWGMSNIMIKRLEGIGTMQMLAWMALFAVVPLWLISAVFEGNAWPRLLTTTPEAAASLAYTVLGSTFGGYGLWNYLLKKYPLSQVTPYSLMTPVFSIAAGQWFFSEGLSWQVIVGGAITIAGVAVIVIRRPRVKEIGEQV